MINTDQNILKDLFYASDRKIEIQTNKKNFYVDNQTLYNEIVICKESGQTTKKLAEMFQKMAIRVSWMPAFRYDNDDDRNDCVSHAVYVMLMNYDKYDESRGTNVFSFFTSTAMNGLRAGWNEIKKHAMITDRFDMIFEENV